MRLEGLNAITQYPPFLIETGIAKKSTLASKPYNKKTIRPSQKFKLKPRHKDTIIFYISALIYKTNIHNKH